MLTDWVEEEERAAGRRAQAWALVNGRGGFDPLESGKVKRWYRLAASDAGSGEYPALEEVLGGTDIAQADADRQPAASVASNGLPTATFDGTDVWIQTLESGNNGTAKWWMLMRVRPVDFGGGQRLYNCTLGGLGGSASATRMRVSLNATTGRVNTDVFVSGNNGRNYTAASVGLTVAAWNSVYIQFDNSLTDEADGDGLNDDAKFRIALGTTFLALTGADVGTGGAVTGLLAATGTAEIGAASNSDTPASPLRNGGALGPNLFFGDEPLTPAQLARLVAFEVPT
jgi:hypothetical protein